MADQASGTDSGNADDSAAAAASSSLFPQGAPSESAPQTTKQPIGGTKHHSHDDDADDDCKDNEPLMSGFFKRSIKVGSFTIKYTDPSSPRPKSARHYEDPTSNSTYHDFVESNAADGCPEEEDDYNDEVESVLHHNQHVSATHAMAHRLQSTAWCKKFCLPLRILLLALYLAFTLSSFWILDSIKEPTLAILVNGELGKHQPRAKMVSFVVVVGMAVAMEWADRAKQGRIRERRAALLMHREDVESDANAALEKSWANRNLPNSMRDVDDIDTGGSGSRWKKMGVRTTRFWKRFHHWGSRDNSGGEDDVEEMMAGEESSSKIGTLAFYVVGSLYIHFFVTVAVALKTHPSFRASSSSADNGNDGSSHANWYYPALGYMLFALVESFGSVSITIFWAFTNSHLTLEAAERHYGSIVAVAQAGAIGGSTLSAILGRRKDQSSVIYDEEGRVDVSFTDSVEEAGGDAQVTPLLIFWACGCIACGMAIMALYAKLFSKPMKQVSSQQGEAVPADAEDCFERIDGADNRAIVSSKYGPTEDSKGPNDSIWKDLFGGVHMIFRHEYLKLVLAVSVLYEIALTCMHYEMNLIGLDRFGVGISISDESDSNHNTDHEDEGITYIQFMGWYGQTVNILSLFLSFYAFPRLIKYYGLAFTIRIFPTVLLVVTLSAFVLFPENLYFLFVSLSICKALTYSVHDPSEEVLYMPTSDDAKFRAKFWIDVVGQRIAKAVGSAINNYAGNVENIVKYGSLPSVVASLVLWVACYQVGVMFDRLIKTGGVVGLEEEKERYPNEQGLELTEGKSVESENGHGDNLADEKLETTLL